MKFGVNRLLVAGITLLSAALILAVVSTVAFAQGPNNWGRGSFGGMMSGNGGMMGGYGGYGGIGSYGGMMGSYGGYGDTASGYAGCGGYGSPGNVDPNAKQISIDQAVQNVDSYLKNTGDADLQIDEVIEFSNNFYANVKEKDTGIHAFELLVDKYTGNVFPEMGPNMMWNTKYGHMTGMMGGSYGWGNQSGQMTVTADQAKQYAQSYLDQNLPETSVGDADQFYGYYTLETEKDGKTTGMLSVNGYNGQVWYHTWHGTYVQTKDLGQPSGS